MSDINKWQPQDDFCLRLSDETAEPRTEEELNEMVDRICEIANEYDFDLSASGSWQGFKHMVMGEFGLRAQWDFKEMLDKQRRDDLKEREEG